MLLGLEGGAIVSIFVVFVVAVVYRVWGSPLGQQLGQLIDFKVLVKLFGDLHQGGPPFGLATLAHKALTD
jgi:hypothetical protein